MSVFGGSEVENGVPQTDLPSKFT